MGLVFELPAPISTNKLWRHIVRGRRAVRIASEEATEWKEAAGLIANHQRAGKPMIQGKFKAELTLYRRKGQQLDVDNSAKIVLDTLQGIAYANDRDLDVLVIQRGEKRDQGGVRVEITEL